MIKIVREEYCDDLIKEAEGLINPLAQYLTYDECKMLNYEWDDEVFEMDDFIEKFDDFEEILKLVDYKPTDLVACFEKERCNKNDND